MDKKVTMQHVALHYKNKEKADIFFKKILGLEIIKDFKLSKSLSEQIFDISQDADVFVYGNQNLVVEVFISPNTQKHVFNHICIKASDKDEFVNKCEKNNLKPYFVEKGDKKLLFVKDHSDNIYEIK